MNKRNATRVEDCKRCFAGLQCDRTGIGLTDKYLCPPGHYCKGGAANKVACPVGTYSQVVGSASSTMCRPCQPGHYCAEMATVVP